MALFTRAGGEVRRIKRAWLADDHGGPVKEREKESHPHLHVEVLWTDSGRTSDLEDACAWTDLRADNGMTEIMTEAQKALRA